MCAWANDSLPLFFFNDTATTEIYTLSLHDALPISPAPLDAPGSHSTLEGRPPTGRRGCGGAHAGDLAVQPATAPAGIREDRRQSAGGTWPGCAARFPGGSYSRWRTLNRRRDPGAIGEIRWAGAGARPLGRSGPRAAAPHVGPLP